MIDAIVATSRAQNAATGITGALIFSAGYFAQLIEGPEEAIGDLMARIASDPRHSDVTVLRDEQIHRRTVTAWSLAYAGQATYVAAMVAAFLQADLANDQSRINGLLSLIVAFART